jgi:hypothetical protein
MGVFNYEWRDAVRVDAGPLVVEKIHYQIDPGPILHQHVVLVAE